MFSGVSSHSTKLDKISVQKKMVLSCFAAAILFFIKNPLVMLSIFLVLLLIYFLVGGLKFLGSGLYHLKITIPFISILATWHLYIDNLDNGVTLFFALFQHS